MMMRRSSILVQGIEINVITAGTGAPILFLHGNPDSAQVWDGVIEHLQADFHCIAIDLPGFGESGPGDDFEVSLENLAAFINEVVAALELALPIHLVVHDIGGPFGLAWAVRHPQRVKGIGILNTIFSSDYRWHVFGRIWRTPILGELSWLLFNRWLFTLGMQRLNPRLSRAQIQRSYDNFDAPMRRMILRFYRATDPEDFQGWEEELQAVLQRVPASVLWGDEDPYIPARFADQFGAQQVHHVPEGGHWLMLERPQWVAATLAELFAAAS